MGETASFATTVQAYGNNTGIVVPPEVLEQLGAGRRPAVHVRLGGDHTFRTTLGVMGGNSLLGISAALRKATGLAGGDPVQVTLTVADTPREVVVPDDLAAALDAEPQARLLRRPAQQPAALPRRLRRGRADRRHPAPPRRQGRDPVP